MNESLKKMNSKPIDLIDYLSSVEFGLIHNYVNPRFVNLKHILSSNTKISSSDLVLVKDENGIGYYLRLSKSFKDKNVITNPCWICTSSILETSIINYNDIMYLIFTTKKHCFNQEVFILKLL